MHPDHRSPNEMPVGARPHARRWPVAVALLALLLASGVLTTSLLPACWRRGPEESAAVGGGSAYAAPSSKPLPADLFRDWPASGRNPDVTLVLSGQQHSYLKFCGCSS